MTQPLIRPIVNINGTDPEELVRARLDAKRAIDDVIERLKDIAPNGRDYPGDIDALHTDRDIYWDRLRALRDLQMALLDEALLIKKD